MGTKNSNYSDCDFAGWATKFNVLCADGRIIKHGAFNDIDGAKIPLIYNHIHDNLSDVLGYYRLSTLKHYSYHMGNRIDDFVTNVKFSKVFKDVEFNNIKTPRSRIVPYRIRKISFSVFNRLFKL